MARGEPRRSIVGQAFRAQQSGIRGAVRPGARVRHFALRAGGNSGVRDQAEIVDCVIGPQRRMLGCFSENEVR